MRVAPGSVLMEKLRVGELVIQGKPNNARSGDVESKSIDKWDSDCLPDLSDTVAWKWNHFSILGRVEFIQTSLREIRLV